MERKIHSGSRYQQFPITRLFKDDIERFIDAGKSHSLSCELSDDEFVYGSLDEVQARRGRHAPELHLAFLKGSAIYPRVELSLLPSKILVYASDGEVALFWHELKALIIERTLWYAKFMSPFMWAFVALFASVYVGATALLVPSFRTSPISVWLLIGLLASGFGMALVSYIYRRFNQGVWLRHQHEDRAILAEYGERLIFLIIGAILGAASIVIANRLTGK